MAAQDMLQVEMETFEAHKAELLADSEGMYALIHHDHVHGTFINENDAIAEGYRTYGNVPFLVCHIVPHETPANFVNSHLGF
jgi:hypothetical protein